ncbi:hypothetical protein BD779DRAFT_1194733 [Infundibulicybe gibba]|nr:hypothetical protein BD779DRAFT_1194733 [Infundibulicybe gibba]
MPSRTDTAWASRAPRLARPIKSAPLAASLVFQPIPLINRIPVELLAKIFSHYVVAFDLDSLVWHTVSSLGRTPTVLGHVCQHWRNTTLAFPTLWSSIVIHSPSRGDLMLAKMWLDRSGSFPLSIYLRPSLKPTPSECERVGDIFKTLCTQLHRWRTVTLILPRDMPSALINIPHGSLISLESATIDARSWPPDVADRLLSSFFSAPSLRRIDWGPRTRQNPRDVPWHQLTHVKLTSNSTPQEILEIMRQCVRLEGVHIICSKSHPPDPQLPVTLPNLRELEIFGDIEPSPLVEYLVLPALVQLKLTYRFRTSATRSRISTIQDLLDRSQCHLDAFIFEDDLIDESELCRLLCIPQLSNITQLRLLSMTTNQVLNLLTRSPTAAGDSPFPRLELLHLRRCHPTNNTFSTMVESRHNKQQGGNGLAQLRVLEAFLRSNDPLENDFTLIKRMCQSGLLARVTTHCWSVPGQLCRC